MVSEPTGFKIRIGGDEDGICAVMCCSHNAEGEQEKEDLVEGHLGVC
jgi:hypothetical protein